MKRMPIPNLVLAATFAVLLPLGQAHCAWMGLQAHTAPAVSTSPAGHECCSSPAAPQPAPPAQPESASQGCACQLLPAGTLPSVLASGAVAPSVTSFAVLTVPSIIAPVSIPTETVPALDVGSSPLPDDPGAHGLRAPPVSA